MAPASSELNLDLLIKLLNMMSSTNDNIALMSARKATQQVEKVGGDWETLLRGKVTIIADPFASASVPPVPQSNWKPNVNRSAPPPPQRPTPPWAMGAAQPRPRPTPPPSPPPSQPRPNTTTVPPKQTAIVNYTLRGSEWILSSSERLDGFTTVTVIRKDGQTKTERVGSFIESKFGRFLYNTGKTNQSSVNDLIF